MNLPYPNPHALEMFREMLLFLTLVPGIFPENFWNISGTEG